jgi:hypothetical protein
MGMGGGRGMGRGMGSGSPSQPSASNPNAAPASRGEAIKELKDEAAALRNQLREIESKIENLTR